MTPAPAPPPPKPLPFAILRELTVPQAKVLQASQKAYTNLMKGK